MEVYWKLTLGKGDINLTASFRRKNDLVEVKMEQELYAVEDIEKIKVLKNGPALTNFPESELDNLKEMFLEKRKILASKMFSRPDPAL